jgi:hypothetical protein
MKLFRRLEIPLFILFSVSCTGNIKTEKKLQTTNIYEHLNCDDSSGYESGKDAGEMMAFASDGERDCDKAYQNWTVEISKSIGFLPEKTDCYCKGFYENYDKKINEKKE